MSEAAFYPPMHSRNQGIFYRGARGIGAKQGSSLGALGRGIYLSWDKGMAGAFARMVDGQVYAYRVAPGLKLLDAQSDEMAEIKASMGFAPHEYSDDPMYTTVITNGVKALGYDGVISDKLAEGLVLFDPTQAQLMEEPMKPNRAQLPEDHPRYSEANAKVQFMRDASSRKRAMPQETAVGLYLRGYDAAAEGVPYSEAPRSIPGLFWRAGYYAHRYDGARVNPHIPMLVEDPSLYFHAIPGTEIFEVAQLIHGKREYADAPAHLKSTQTAGRKMREAAQGIIPTRRPISLCDNRDGTYTVMDGNATYAQAVINGWEEIPGVVEQVGDCPDPMRRGNPGRGPTAFRSLQGGEGIAGRAFVITDGPDRGRAGWVRVVEPSRYGRPAALLLELGDGSELWTYENLGEYGGFQGEAPLRRSNPLEPYKLEVEGDTPQATLAQALARGVEQAADVCQITPPVCEGNLGVPRDQMPQLREAVIPSYLDALERDGYLVDQTAIPVGQLQATQREIDANKVLGMLGAYRAGNFPSITAPVIVSTEADGDHHILDGHHRWATLLVDAPGNCMEVHLVDAPIRELLARAANFEGVQREGFMANPRERGERGESLAYRTYEREGSLEAYQILDSVFAEYGIEPVGQSTRSSSRYYSHPKREAFNQASYAQAAAADTLHDYPTLGKLWRIRVSDHLNPIDFHGGIVQVANWRSRERQMLPHELEGWDAHLLRGHSAQEVEAIAHQAAQHYLALLDGAVDDPEWAHRTTMRRYDYHRPVKRP